MEKIQLEPRKFLAPEYIFGLDSRRMAASYCRKFGAKRVLLVVDEGITNSPWYPELVDSLTAQNVEFEVFSELSANPRDYQIEAGKDLFIEKQCNLLLAMGGGSVVDAAKGIGIVSSNGAPIHNFEGVDLVRKPIPPLIAVPTTSGASADVSQFSIINNSKEKYKMAIISKALVPDVSLIDPIVLTSMDNYLTACVGMDALVHAIEAFVSNANSPVTDMYAIEAIKLINGNLIEIMKEPENIQRRGKLMLASLYAGLAFSNASLGSVHSMAHSLGGFLDLAHGECNAILLPHVINYNYPSAESRYRKIAELFDLPVSSLNSGERKKALMNHIVDMQKNLEIEATLGKYGVRSDLTSILASKAINDPCNATNPRVPSKEDLDVIYKEAL